MATLIGDLERRIVGKQRFLPDEVGEGAGAQAFRERGMHY
jgi:hypothetical protein